MASLASISISLGSAPKSALYSPISSISHLRTPELCLSAWTPQLGFTSFSLWSGLKHIGRDSIYQRSSEKKERRCRHKSGIAVRASLFGVGAPEALVIGVVALLVFGPKGLAEVARNLGKTLRAFQPTIKELQDVSREFKSTLEREIGLDDISNQTQNTYSSNRTDMPSAPPSTGSTENSVTMDDPNGVPSSTRAYTSEEYWKITEEQPKTSAVQQPEQSAPSDENQLRPQTQSDPPASGKTAGQVPPPEKPESKI